jgi:hypothetical protein
MPYILQDKEFAAVMSLGPGQRYQHLVGRIADFEEVWSLAGEDGWVLLGDDEGRELVPIWPHPRYAEVCASAEWPGATPKLIGLLDFLDKWCPGLERDNRLIAAFPDASINSTVVPPNRLLDDVRQALSEVE